MRSLARRDVTGRGAGDAPSSSFRARFFRPVFVVSLTETDGETRAFERVDRSRSTGELDLDLDLNFFSTLEVECSTRPPLQTGRRWFFARAEHSTRASRPVNACDRVWCAVERLHAHVRRGQNALVPRESPRTRRAPRSPEARRGVALRFRRANLGTAPRRGIVRGGRSASPSGEGSNARGQRARRRPRWLTRRPRRRSSVTPMTS